MYGFYIRTFIELSLELSTLGLVEIIMKQVGETNEKISYYIGVLSVLTVVIMSA